MDRRQRVLEVHALGVRAVGAEVAGVVGAAPDSLVPVELPVLGAVGGQRRPVAERDALGRRVDVEREDGVLAVEQGRIGRDLQGGAGDLERDLGRRVPAAGAFRRSGSPSAAGSGTPSVASGSASASASAEEAVRTSCVVTLAGVSPAESHMRPAGLSKTGVPSPSRATKPPSAVGAMFMPPPETVILIVASAGFFAASAVLTTRTEV